MVNTMKRIVDLFIATLALIILTPVMAIISVLIKLDSKGKIIFKQTRVGRFNKEFCIYKFRTMIEKTPDLPTDLIDATSFVTRIGKFLRKTSLDEIPQLINVIKGDMSLVGPRPALYSQVKLNNYRTILGVDKLRPGITGWAQINGRDDIGDYEKAKLDEYYLKNRSLIFDVKIVYLTFFAVVSAKGIKA